MHDAVSFFRVHETTHLGQIYDQYFTQSSALAVEHRCIHECGTISLEEKTPTPRFEIKLEVISAAKLNVSSKEEVPKKSPRVWYRDPASQCEQAVRISNEGKSKFDAVLQSHSLTNDAKSKFDTAIDNRAPPDNDKPANSVSKAHFEIGDTAVSASVVGQILHQSTPAHHRAATRIQVTAVLLYSQSFSVRQIARHVFVVNLLHCRLHGVAPFCARSCRWRLTTHTLMARATKTKTYSTKKKRSLSLISKR